MEENNQTAAMSAAEVDVKMAPTLSLSPREKTLASVGVATAKTKTAAEATPEQEDAEEEEGEAEEEDAEEGENNNAHHSSSSSSDKHDNNAAESGHAADAADMEESSDVGSGSDSAETEKEEDDEDDDEEHAEQAASAPAESTEAKKEEQEEEEEEEAEEEESANTASEATAPEEAPPPPAAQAVEAAEEQSAIAEAAVVVEIATVSVLLETEEATVVAAAAVESAVELSAGSILDPSPTEASESSPAEELTEKEQAEMQTEDFSGLELRIDVHTEDFNSPNAADLDLDLDSDGDSDSEEEDDMAEHEPLDKSGESRSLPSVPLTMTYPVNDMEVVTNRGGRAGSLSKFLDDADLYRRRSLTSYNDDPLGGFQQKKLTLEAFLDMAIDPILEVLDDADSDVRLWLLQSETVEAVLKEFVKPPVFTGEPHEEYGFYKNYFICSEIIMKLYTGEDDLYESFSSDSSSGSASANTVFGCQEDADLQKWELLYSIFDNQAPLDEMQLLFFSKALVRLHDGFCLEDGYVSNVLRVFLPRVMPHLYSNTIKYMLTLILQSYESVHPITGRNDAMEIVVPLLAKATRLKAEDSLNTAAVENASHLVVDMLQANQADRLGAFCRREGGVYLSKYFVRDQFGTIRGFESMTHGYHNFLQFMFLEELGKWPSIVQDIFENALFELQEIQSKKVQEVSGCLNVQVATEMLLLFKKHGAELASSDEDSVSGGAEMSPVNSNPYSDSYPGSPRQSGLDASMYNLRSLTRAESLWSNILNVATSTAERFCTFLNTSLPSSVEIALSKHLHALVHLNNADLDQELHKGGLMQRYLLALERRPSFDMLLIHIVPAIAFIIKDADCTRSRDNWLTLDLFDEVDGASSLPQLIVRADEDIPSLKIYAGLLKDVIDEVLTTKSPTQNNITLQRMCKRCPPWGSPRYSRRSSSSPKLDRQSSISSPQPVSPEPEAVSAPSPAPSAAPSTLPSSPEESALPSPVEEQAAATASPPAPEQAQPEVAERMSTIRRLSSRKSVRSSSQRNSEKLTPDQIPASAAAASPASSRESESAEPESGKKSTHYIKQMLQTPVFRGSMRLGSVIKPPEKSPRSSDLDQSNQPSQRGSFGWNSVLKRLRKSFVSTGHEKGDKKMLAIANEPYVPPNVGQATQADVLVVDMAKGEDVSKLVHRDGGVFVQDVPAKLQGDKPQNTVTSGYLYKSKFPETGQRNLWERYYFVLDRHDGLLSYYVSESHAKDRTFLRGTARPVSVTEGIPVSANGQHSVYGFQINTQGHGAFMVVVDSIDTRLVWLSEIVTCVSLLTPQVPQKRLSLVGDESAAAVAKMLANGGKSWSKQQLKELVVDYYKNLFGPSLRFNTPMDAPASFWMEEKIEPVAESCVLSSNLPDCVPYWGEFHGYKRLCDFWKIRDETIERSSGRVLRIVVDEDEETAVVMTSTTYRILRNSQTVTEESCDIVNMSGGAIISIHCTFDSFRIAEAFRKEGISAS